MSIDDERELRRRLDGALEAITPSPAPAAATLRKGKTIRTRRRISVVAGLAAAVGIALAAPSLVHQFARQAPITPNRTVLTVYPPGPYPPNGQIAWGTINGKRWQIAVTSDHGPSNQCVTVDDYTNAVCAPAANASQDRSLPVVFSALDDNGISYDYGVVQPDVARVVIALADGTRLTLHPYPLYGQRWVAFAVPTDLAIANATAYSRRSELAYAIPYGDEFVTWLRPGEQGLPVATYVIGSGVVNGVAWSDVVHVGPWGYCSSIAQPPSTSGACIPAPRRIVTGNSYTSRGGIAGGDSIIGGQASPAVAYVVGTLSDASTVRARAVDVGGPRFWTLVLPKGQRLRRVVFYSASGHQVAVQYLPAR